MNKISGRGCEPFVTITGLPQHNPAPSTPRGKRRLEARNDNDKKRAEAAWQKERSSRPSRYQRRRGGQHPGQK